MYLKSQKKNIYYALLAVSILTTILIILFIDKITKSNISNTMQIWLDSESANLQQGNYLSTISKLERYISKENSQIQGVKLVFSDNDNTKNLIEIGTNFQIEIEHLNESTEQQIRNDIFLTKYTFSRKIGDDLYIFVKFSTKHNLLFFIYILIYFILFILIYNWSNTYFFKKIYLFRVKAKQRQTIKRTANLNKRALEAQRLAHDIRSPLSTLSLLADKFTDAQDKDLARSIVNQVTNISQELLNSSKKDLQMLSKNETPIETQTHQLNEEQTHQITFKKLFEQLQLEYKIKQPTIKSKIEFEINKSILNISDFAPRFLYASINNLIQNSIEATENSTNAIIRLTATLNSNKQFIVAIEDNGHGIPASIIDRIGNESLSYGKEDSNSGSGIGLFTLKKNLKEISGDLKISSEENKKTTFTVAFPVSTFTE